MIDKTTNIQFSYREKKGKNRLRIKTSEGEIVKHEEITKNIRRELWYFRDEDKYIQPVPCTGLRIPFARLTAAMGLSPRLTMVPEVARTFVLYLAPPSALHWRLAHATYELG